ncbi:hypothetical protein QG37_05349 [Candidozyma auris]|nr:hypothetical protein QG37_05349 [[Candida] auris]
MWSTSAAKKKNVQVQPVLKFQRSTHETAQLKRATNQADTLREEVKFK